MESNFDKYHDLADRAKMMRIPELAKHYNVVPKTIYAVLTSRRIPTPYASLGRPANSIDGRDGYKGKSYMAHTLGQIRTEVKAKKKMPHENVKEVRKFLPLYREFAEDYLAGENKISVTAARMYAIAHRSKPSDEELEELLTIFTNQEYV